MYRSTVFQGMKKNIAIIVLIIAVVISFFEVRAMSHEASYWMKRCYAIEAAIQQATEDDFIEESEEPVYLVQEVSRFQKR